jgi:glutathione synthase/RimK-type ligase-like ATP-grasp enzyme
VLIGFVTYSALPLLSDDDQLVRTPLVGHGVRVEGAVWDSPKVEWERFDALVIRSCWDYHERPNEFEQWLTRMETLGVPVWNPPSLIRWNMDKHYLSELEQQGVFTVPTIWLDQGAPHSLSEIVAERGWDEIVVKPSMSNSGVRTWRSQTAELPMREADFRTLVFERDVMVQPFVPELQRDGEWSFIFFDGTFSHAVRKRARDGEFRVQNEHGGRANAETPRPSLVEEAARILSFAPDRWVYARVDGCERDGALMLTELEMLEPSLYLSYHPQAAQRFADAIWKAVER